MCPVPVLSFKFNSVACSLRVVFKCWKMTLVPERGRLRRRRAELMCNFNQNVRPFPDDEIKPVLVLNVNIQIVSDVRIIVV